MDFLRSVPPDPVSPRAIRNPALACHAPVPGGSPLRAFGHLGGRRDDCPADDPRRGRTHARRNNVLSFTALGERVP